MRVNKTLHYTRNLANVIIYVTLKGNSILQKKGEKQIRNSIYHDPLLSSVKYNSTSVTLLGNTSDSLYRRLRHDARCDTAKTKQRLQTNVNNAGMCK
jgi:hypothetical protein